MLNLANGENIKTGIGALRSREHRYTLDPYADYVLTTGVGWASAI